MNLVCTGAI